MQSFIHTVILVVWSGFCLHFGHSEEQSWNLRVSDPSRDGRFLSVPIYYGDWVPISQAKHTIESVASKIQAATSPVRLKIYALGLILGPLISKGFLFSQTNWHLLGQI